MSRFNSVVLSVGLSLFSASCGHTSGSVGATRPTQPPAQATRPANLPRTDGSASSDELDSRMKEHFMKAVWARDSVVDGALEPMREPLRALSDYGYETFPLAWMGGIARLQAAARTTANAESLEAAASGIASLASICGRCHLDQGYVLPLGDITVDAERPLSDGIATRMSRHALAVERLWEGLVAPSDEAWRAGAAAMAHAPMKAPKPNSPAPRDFARDFEELRSLGVRAQSASALHVRVEIYGKVLTTCSRCHAHVDEHDPIRARSPQP